MRFAVLHHDDPFPHWDLLLEAGESCRTWRLLDDPAGPGPWRAEAIADHRPFYLDYEGPVSGNRGQVTAWDRGEFDGIVTTESLIRVRCHGAKWHGELTLRHQTECQWEATLIAEPSVES
jgi:hypothetical protein